MIRVQLGDRVRHIITGRLGNVTAAYQVANGEWLVEIAWDRTTLRSIEVEPYEEEDS